MNESPPPRKGVDEYAHLWSKLVGPMLLCFVGIAGFGYSLVFGHDATFGSISAGLAAAGAGLGADILRRASA
jgi:hypothetical protein